jgi:hypothetical protein
MEAMMDVTMDVMMEQNFLDTMQIRDAIERWALYRDSLMWDKFREVWHPDGVMTATWTEGPFEDFIKITEEGVKHGLNIMHVLGGSAIEVKGNRGVSMTRFMILQRAMLDGALCDVTCYARHYDLWEKRGGKWGLVYRGTIADKDRIDTVDGNERVALDKKILDRFPVEYRHLAYLQTKVGYNVDTDCPRMSGGKALEALYKKGADWLAACAS